MDTQTLKMGWLVVAFDLPVGTREQRKCATNFRKFLLEDGFQMIQWSLYARSCVSSARQKTHMARVRQNLPPEGSVRAIFVTRSQWDHSFVIHGAPAEKAMPENMPEQLMIW
jgi:CRISPR-associated protein Cas2